MEILRVSNIAGPTSAPFNTFTLFRSKVYRHENTTYLAYRRLEKTFKSELKRDAVDVIFNECNGSILKLTSFVFRWLRLNRLNKNKIIHAHQPGVGSISFLSASLLSFFSVPLVYTVHNSMSNFKGIKKVAVCVCFALSDRITFVSNDSFRSFESSLPQWVLRKSIVIQNGADIDRIRQSTLNHKKNTPDKTIVVSCIGRLAPQKNLSFLLEVVAKINKDFRLNIYGEGSDRDLLSGQISQLGLSEKVFLCGNLPKIELFQKIQDSDIYVSSAHYEGLPMGLIEALALDVPCLVSDISSHQEIKEYISCLELVENDIDQWVASLTRKIELSEIGESSIRIQLSSPYIEEYFSMSRMQKEYMKVYSNLLQTAE